MTESTQAANLDTSIFADRESEVRSYSRNWPVVFDTAKGTTLTTVDGDEYLDFFGGAGALNPADFRHAAPTWFDPRWLDRHTAFPTSTDHPMTGVLS